MELVYFFNLFSYFIKGLIAISDIAVIVLLIYILFFTKIRIYKKKYNIILIVFWVITGISGLLNVVANSNYFIFTEFVISYLKLSLYILFFLIAPYYFSARLNKLNNIITNSLVIICILGIYQIVVYNFFPKLPYSLASEIGLIQNKGGISTMISYGGKFRIKSIFAEPSIFAIYSTLLYSYILHYRIKISRWVHLLVNVSIILSFSMSGIGLLFINYFLLFFKYYKKNKKYLIYVLIVLTIFSISIITNDYLSYRIARIIDLSEGSSNTRLLGAWEIALKAPVYGVGLGHSRIYNSYIGQDNLKFHISGKGVHNTFAVILTTTGYLGLLLFLIFIYYLFRRNFIFGLFFIASGFGWGYFNVIPIWMILSLVATTNLFLEIDRKYS